MFLFLEKNDIIVLCVNHTIFCLFNDNLKRKEMVNLDVLWQKGKDFLGTKYAILGGAMSWVSESNLVSAISNAGAFGVIAGGSMDVTLLRKMIQDTQAKTKNPFGVNLIVLHPDLQALVDVCIEEKVSHIVFAAGFPSSTIIKQLKDHGIKVMCFTPNASLGKRLIKTGVDALIIEGSEAGGHIGPVSTSVLMQEILPEIKDVPIFVAGGIGNGEMMASIIELGASGVQLGTAFVCTNESIAHDNFKNAFIKASAKDAQPTVQIDNEFSVIPVRAIVNKGTKDFLDLQKLVVEEYKSGNLSKYDAQMKIEHYWVGALKKAVIDGDVVNGSLMAGQSVGMVKSISSVSDVVENMVASAREYLSK